MKILREEMFSGGVLHFLDEKHLAHESYDCLFIVTKFILINCK